MNNSPEPSKFPGNERLNHARQSKKVFLFPLIIAVILTTYLVSFHRHRKTDPPRNQIATQYEVKPLDLDGEPLFFARPEDINENGQILIQDVQSVIIWRGGKIERLYRLPDWGFAFSMNNDGMVLASFTRKSKNKEYILWSKEKIINLDTSSLGSRFMLFRKINNKGVILCLAYMEPEGRRWSFWSSGIVKCIENEKVIDTSIILSDLNDENVTAGSMDVKGNEHAIIMKDKVITDIGALLDPEKESKMVAINNRGDGVGTVMVNGKKHMFFWDGNNATDLGNFSDGKGEIFPRDINNKGQVVGHIEMPKGDSYPFLWDKKTGFHDLNDLISTNAGWVLWTAQALNDKGEIVGTGMRKHKNPEGFLLIPIDIEAQRK